MTQIKINKSNILDFKTDALVLGVFEKTEKFKGLLAELDEVFQNKISNLYSENEIRGKLGEITIIHNFVDFSAERLVIVGLGKLEEFDADVVRKVSSSVLNRLNGINLKQVSFSLIGSDLIGIFNSIGLAAYRVPIVTFVSQFSRNLNGEIFPNLDILRANR